MKQLASENALDLSKIHSLLKTKWLGHPVGAENELWDEIDSTNGRALQLAQNGAPAGVMVIARQQTAGRGRLGRTWHSPKDAGLYFTFLLRPKVEAKTLPLFTLATGWATARAIHAHTGLAIGLKWVNDLILCNRKIGGILAELGSEGTSSNTLVIGIGININCQSPPPQEIVDKTGWLEDFCDCTVDRNVLLSQIALEMESAIGLLLEGNLAAILNGWRSYSITLGEEIMVLAGDTSYKGTALDITDGGALVIQTKDGKREFHAGEVSIKRADGQYV